MKALGGSIERRGKQSVGSVLMGLLGLILGLSASSAQAQLNDTGVDRHSNSTSFIPTEPANFPGQDPSYGRDMAAAAGQLPKVGGGANGFDFTKLDNTGNPLPPSAGSWTCVRDNVTGLEWEVKTDDGGLRGKDWLYSWYSTDSSSNGGNPGDPTPYNNPVRCGGTLTHCNTREYAAAVNQAGLCGHVDWHLPTIEELRSIVDYDNDYLGARHTSPAIDINYFPNTVSSCFWSSSVLASSPDRAWQLQFAGGHDSVHFKESDCYVRLVRGGQPPLGGTPRNRPECLETIPESTPTSDFILYEDGTAVHYQTGLMWMRCALGQTWNGSTCTGTASTYNWQQALKRAANATFTGYGDWRLPNIKELSSIAERRCYRPAINATVFPNTPNAPPSSPWSTPTSWFWSSSLSTWVSWDNASRALGLQFWLGDVYHDGHYKGLAGHVRLVRGGHPFDDFYLPGTPPPAATLIAPTGTITDNTPKYGWYAVANAAKYYLKVKDGSGTVKIGKWYTAAQAGCAAGKGGCLVIPDTVLANGTGKWWIRTWNAAGYGPWSAPLAFTLSSP